LRAFAIGKVDMKNDNVKEATVSTLADLAKNDPERPVRAAAIAKLGQAKDAAYKALFASAVNDSSYSVAGSALDALSNVDSEAALAEAKRLATEKTKGRLTNAINMVLVNSGDESVAGIVIDKFDEAPFGQAKFNLIPNIIQLLTKTKNTDLVKKGVDAIVKFRDEIPEAYRANTDPFINNQLKGLAQKKTGDAMTDQADYIKGKLPADDKKGF
jgi:aminopeptidase N